MLAGFVAFGLVLGATYLVMTALGQGGGPPSWVMVVGTAAAVGAIVAVMRRGQRQPTAPPAAPEA
jgi:hypothetical protein